MNLTNWVVGICNHAYLGHAIRNTETPKKAFRTTCVKLTHRSITFTSVFKETRDSHGLHSTAVLIQFSSTYTLGLGGEKITKKQ